MPTTTRLQTSRHLKHLVHHSVTLRRKSGSFGIILKGTSDSAIVRSLTPNGAAFHEGTLRPNDKIHRVNDVDVTGWKFNAVLGLIGKTGTEEDLVLGVWRGAAGVGVGGTYDGDATTRNGDIAETRKRKRRSVEESSLLSLSPGKLLKAKEKTGATSSAPQAAMSTRQSKTRVGASPPLLPTRASVRVASSKKSQLATLERDDNSTESTSAHPRRPNNPSVLSPAEDINNVNKTFFAKIKSTIQKLETMEPTPYLTLFRAFLHVVQIPSFHGQWYPLHGWAKIISHVYSQIVLGTDAENNGQEYDEDLNISRDELGEILTERYFLKEYLGVNSNDLVRNEAGLYLTRTGIAGPKQWCLFVGDCEAARGMSLLNVDGIWLRKMREFIQTDGKVEAAVTGLQLKAADVGMLRAAMRQMRPMDDEPQDNVCQDHVDRSRVAYPMEGEAARKVREEAKVQVETTTQPLDMDEFPTLMKYSVPLTLDGEGKKEREMLLRELTKLKFRPQNSQRGHGEQTLEGGPTSVCGGAGSTPSTGDASSSLSGSGNARECVPPAKRQMAETPMEVQHDDLREKRRKGEPYPLLASLQFIKTGIHLSKACGMERFERLLLGELVKKCAKPPLPAMALTTNYRNTMVLAIPQLYNTRKKRPFSAIRKSFRTTGFLRHMLTQVAGGDVRVATDWIVRHWLMSKETIECEPYYGVLDACAKAGFYLQPLDENGLPITDDPGNKYDLKPHPECTGTFYIDQMERLPIYITIRIKEDKQYFQVNMPPWMCKTLKGNYVRGDERGQILKSFPRTDAGLKRAVEWRDSRIDDYERESGEDARARMAKITAKLDQQPRGENARFVLKRQRKGKRRRKVDEHGQVIDEEEEEEEDEYEEDGAYMEGEGEDENYVYVGSYPMTAMVSLR